MRKTAYEIAYGAARSTLEKAFFAIAPQVANDLAEVDGAGDYKRGLAVAFAETNAADLAEDLARRIASRFSEITPKDEDGRKTRRAALSLARTAAKMTVESILQRTSEAVEAARP